MSKVIKKTTLEDGTIISTVDARGFLAWYGNFETAIVYDHDNIRILKGYDTIEEAIKGHEYYSSLSLEELDKLEKIG